MNLLQMIQADFVGMRQLLANMGNSPQPSNLLRREATEVVLEAWRAHGRVLDLVMPVLSPELAQRVRDGFARVERHLLDLAGEQEGPLHPWLDDFTLAKEAFEAQSLLQEKDVVDALLTLPPGELAELTQRARALTARSGTLGPLQAASGDPVHTGAPQG